MVAYRQSNTLVDCVRVWPLLASTSHYYPDLEFWFWNKAVPGIVAGNQGLYLAESGSDVVGVSLFRLGKLRCIRVRNDFVSKGVAPRLLDRVLEIIGDKPYCSVSEELINDYSRLLVNGYGFNLTTVARGMYRLGKLEYMFNGALQQVTSL